MTRIILCEGETDAILLSLYLGKKCGWAYTAKSSLNVEKNEQINIVINAYERNGEILYICAVGGKDCFGYFYNKYVLPLIQLSNNEETEFRIALVSDIDNRAISEIETDVLSQLSPTITQLSNNEWIENTIENSFGQTAKIEFLLNVIPPKGEGALETVLMTSLAELQSGEIIVQKSKNFVDIIAPDAKAYIPTKRLQLKSQLGVVLSVLYPDKVFSQFDQQLQIVDWEKFNTLKECFNELIKI